MRTTVWTLLLAACLTHAPAIARADLADFITDLYADTRSSDPDINSGIVLPPAGPPVSARTASAHTAHFTGESQLAELNALSNGILAGTGIYALN